jgi:hypothetical protein
MAFSGRAKTHRKDNIDHIHQNQDQVCYTGEVECIRSRHQNNGYDVVGQHLPVILATFLNVDHYKLL